MISAGHARRLSHPFRGNRLGKSPDCPSDWERMACRRRQFVGGRGRAERSTESRAPARSARQRLSNVKQGGSRASSHYGRDHGPAGGRFRFGGQRHPGPGAIASRSIGTDGAGGPAVVGGVPRLLRCHVRGPKSAAPAAQWQRFPEIRPIHEGLGPVPRGRATHRRWPNRNSSERASSRPVAASGSRRTPILGPIAIRAWSPPPAARGRPPAGFR